MTRRFAIPPSASRSARRRWAYPAANPTRCQVLGGACS
ncbi:hypothetical protein DB32_006006 [Sandaracinus amylolyticus]|uniref:Uncharacterized protein n=1 Tax=Sandaracinus amylolyticus TaxID=927083 RepID=A0A0F6YKW6_9BACT|nr:hypothetical protein DB32_006006 [Sandaracinus amylolyticus]